MSRIDLRTFDSISHHIIHAFSTYETVLNKIILFRGSILQTLERISVVTPYPEQEHLKHM